MFLQYLIYLCLLVSCALSSFNQKGISSKILLYTKRDVIEKKCRDSKIVLVGGCFDLLHYGHIKFLEKAKGLGKYLFVALESDARILKYKKRSPIHNQYERAQILASLIFVDKVILLPLLEGFEDYNNLVKDLCPSVIAVSQFDPQLKNKEVQAKAINSKVIEVTNLLKNSTNQNFSSSNILKELQ